MPSPITQNIGSAVSSTGLGTAGNAAGVARDVAANPTSTQIAKAVTVATDKVSQSGGDDKRRTARAQTRVEGSYSPKSVQPKSAKKQQQQSDSSSDGESSGKLDTVA